MSNSPRQFPEGFVPLLSFEGTSFECGEQLGLAWQHSLKLNAELACAHGWTPWWWKGRGGVVADVVERVAPHLVAIYRGMAKGAGIDEALCTPGPIAQPFDEGCTSFGIHKSLTLDGHALTGQTKDTGFTRTPFYQVLRLKPSDGPGYLTLTYPGELLGHGFASPGMGLFRNALFVTMPRKGELPFDAFGLLVSFSKSLDDAIELTRRHGVRLTAHVTVTDATGRSAGIETAGGEVEIIQPRDGVYVHANHTVTDRFKPRITPQDDEQQCAGASEHRQQRLTDLINLDRGRLTPQLMLHNLSDHANYPASICSHRGRDYHTTAAVVAEPSRGLLHVTRGAPCQNWPQTYRL